MKLKLEFGIPSHDTFERVFAMIDPKEMEKCFMSWVKAVNRLTEGEIVSIDGKTICASCNDNKKAIHKLWLNTSHLPKIQSFKMDIWRRIKVIPLNAVILDEEKRYLPNLQKLLEKEAEGIATWVMKGLKKYKQEGLGTCEAVEIATK